MNSKKMLLLPATMRHKKRNKRKTDMDIPIRKAKHFETSKM